MESTRRLVMYFRFLAAEQKCRIHVWIGFHADIRLRAKFYEANADTDE